MSFKIFIYACLAMLSVNGMLHAGQFIPLSVEDLCDRSHVVIRGTVLGKNVEEDAQGRIYTRLEVRVDESLKGMLGSNLVTVVHGGGVLDNRRLEVSGQVSFSVGEEVVLFAVWNERGQAVSVGLAQGKFHIRKGPDGRKFAGNPYHGTVSGLGVAGGKQELDLEELRQRVKARSK